MLIRHETIAAASCAAILAGIGIFPASAQPVREAPAEIDRELKLSISDAFTRQTWSYGGRVWTETRDTLSLHEGECVRVSIINDTAALRVLSLGDDRPLLRIPSGRMVSVALTVDGLAPFSISVVGQPIISRRAKVHPNHGRRANVV